MLVLFVQLPLLLIFWTSEKRFKDFRSEKVNEKANMTTFDEFSLENATSDVIGMDWLATANDSVPVSTHATSVANMISTTIATSSASLSSWFTTTRIQITLYIIILLLAIIGNALVILTLIQNRRMRTITNVFLLNLAISDILLGVLCMPITLIGTLLRDFVFGEIMCKLLPYLQGNVYDAFILMVFVFSCIDSGMVVWLFWFWFSIFARQTSFSA